MLKTQENDAAPFTCTFSGADRVGRGAEICSIAVTAASCTSSWEAVGVHAAITNNTVFKWCGWWRATDFFFAGRDIEFGQRVGDC